MAISETHFSFPGQSDFYRGKVRDVYTVNDDTLVSVATDRISAFDVILPEPIPHKGQVLNQLAAYFLEQAGDIAPTWLQNVPDPNVSIGVKCEPFRVEMVIRSCLVGHAWREYKNGVRELCGVKLPDGMREYDMFDEPIITPSTKAAEGHDEDISAKDIVEQGVANEAEFEQLSILTRQLFNKGRQQAKASGLTLADTKYEFGKYNNEIYVIDEIHTPDSSRYFYAESYDAYLKNRNDELPKHLSKEFVRQWLLEHGFSGQEGQKLPKMSGNFIEAVSQRYIELYEQLTGSSFLYPAPDTDLLKRIEMNVRSELETKG